MSYLGISVKEAINNINNDNNGWFLPAVQRPYVWGSRHENEQYICKLFDSILRGYPIGGLIAWSTEEKIPYREFMPDYKNGDIPNLVDAGLHGRKDKWLVYDGQQRLQTLYSCLKYTFNGRVIVYDLLFNLLGKHDPDETGFSFVDKNSKVNWNYLRLNELFSKLSDQDSDFEDEVLAKKDNLSSEEKKIIKKNLKQLWKVYVETDKASLAYFPIQSSNENEVNEIFERLNSGGMALSQADLLFSRIKGNDENYDFEEKLQLSSKEIYNKTGKGYLFGAYSILQLLNLIVKGRVRVDPKIVKDNELSKFSTEWTQLEIPLHDYFTDYIWGQFKINNASIIPRKLALLPMMVYFYEIYKKGFKFKHITSTNLKYLNQYFIKSQINDWNLQSYADNFVSIIKKASTDAGKQIFDFPIMGIENKINEKKQRNTAINEEGLRNYLWFSLKVFTPNRVYQFEPDIRGRFNPEIDHIFPVKLKGSSSDYRNNVDIIWNMQPTKGDINGFKTNHHPKLFFTDKITNSNGALIVGSKYISDYDFLLPKDARGKIDFSSAIWDSEELFIKERKKLMLEYLSNYYGISVN
ncbi:MAG: DUF262 domain-containing protein [Gammaproteobacteria bacterium]|nr:DUF262 domain-containing protein [Gammaproteobacteria bacterium]